MRHLQSFNYVKMIAERGSIRGAAEHFTISPSALNRHIQTLESELGIQIFERLKRGVRLSTEGELFYQFAQNQLANFEHLKSQIDNVKGLRTGSVRVGISSDLSRRFIHRLIASYQEDHPNVAFEVIPIERNLLDETLADNRIDFALCYQPVLGRDLQIIHAVETPVCAAHPVGVPIESKSGLRLYDLLDHPVVMPPSDSALRLQIQSACEKMNLELAVKMECTDPLEHLRVTHQSRTAFVLELPEDRQTFEIAGFKLTELSAIDVPRGFVALVSSTHKLMSIASERFLDKLIQNLESAQT